MTIHIELSTESINRAIERLHEAQENLEYGVQQLVEILTREGVEEAQSSYGDMAAVSSETDVLHGTIMATGEAVIIAEFGAGQATMPVMFENAPETPVYEGSYSELVGTQEYYRFGSWHFGGKYYTEVPARHGLLNAKTYIQENSTRIAQEVIHL